MLRFILITLLLPFGFIIGPAVEAIRICRSDAKTNEEDVGKDH